MLKEGDRYGRPWRDIASRLCEKPFSRLISCLGLVVAVVEAAEELQIVLNVRIVELCGDLRNGFAFGHRGWIGYWPRFRNQACCVWPFRDVYEVDAFLQQL